MRQKRDFRIEPRNGARALFRSDGDICEFFRSGVLVNAAIGKHQRAALDVRIARFGRDHQKIAGNQRHAGHGLYDLQTGAQRIGRGMARAGNEPVGVPRFEHQHAEIGIVGGKLVRVLFGHALILSEFIQKFGVFRPLGTGFGIDDGNAVEILVGVVLSDFRFVA